MNRYKFRRVFDKLLRGRLIQFLATVAKYKTDPINGRQFRYSLCSDIGRTLYFKGQFESQELEICKRYIRRTSVVLDVGANIGWHSVYFADIASAGQVIAFEPSPSTYQLLLRNTRDSRVIPLNVALSDTTQVADFFEAADDAYSGLKDTKRKPIVGVRRVFACRLDDLFGGLLAAQVDFVKIDVEGLELSVLQGMQRLIEKHRPVIFCEIYQGVNSNPYPDDTVSFLTSRGYDAFVISGDQLVPCTAHSDSQYNYFFVPRSS